MPTITVSDEAFAQLKRRAEQLSTTVEAVAAIALAEAGVQPPRPPHQLPYAEWQKWFDAFNASIERRGPDYPPGFQVDDSRESIYEGRGE